MSAERHTNGWVSEPETQVEKGADGKRDFGYCSGGANVFWVKAVLTLASGAPWARGSTHEP